jgi:hypothetical protein
VAAGSPERWQVRVCESTRQQRGHSKGLMRVSNTGLKWGAGYSEVGRALLERAPSDRGVRGASPLSMRCDGSLKRNLQQTQKLGRVSSGRAGPGAPLHTIGLKS